MNHDAKTDEEWLARMIGDDEEALVLLMRKYYVHLAQFANSLLGRHELAEEAVSNVFISLWQRRKKVVIRNSLRHYLFSAVSKQAATLLSSDVIRRDLVPLDDVPPHQLVDAVPDEWGILYRELHDEIERLLATMPPQRQLVFRMSRLGGMRYREIGKELGISEFTVRSHIAKAMRMLKDALPAIRERLKKNPRNE